VRGGGARGSAARSEGEDEIEGVLEENRSDMGKEKRGEERRRKEGRGEGRGGEVKRGEERREQGGMVNRIIIIKRF
jgi:hypothetical protein